MSRIVRIALAVICTGIVCASPAGAVEGTNRAEVAVAAATAGTNLWFAVGEELVYKIYWGYVPVGKTRIITRWTDYQGRRLLLVQYRTRSNKVLASVYPVDDVIESLIDPVTFRPVRFVKNIKEGRHRHYEVTDFDYTTMTAHWRSLFKKKEKTYPLERDTRDLVAFLYYMRRQPLQPGMTSQYRVMADDKIYDLSLRTAKKEKIDLPDFGDVESLRIEPTAQFNGLFVRKGKMTLWVSCDSRMLCTRIDAKVPVASVRVLLSEVHGPGDDEWTRRTKKNRDGKKPDDDDLLVDSPPGETVAGAEVPVVPGGGEVRN